MRACVRACVRACAAIRIRKVAAFCTLFCTRIGKIINAEHDTLGANNYIEDQNLCSGAFAARTDAFLKLDIVSTIQYRY